MTFPGRVAGIPVYDVYALFKMYIFSLMPRGYDQVMTGIRFFTLKNVLFMFYKCNTPSLQYSNVLTIFYNIYSHLYYICHYIFSSYIFTILHIFHSSYISSSHNVYNYNRLICTHLPSIHIIRVYHSFFITEIHLSSFFFFFFF